MYILIYIYIYTHIYTQTFLQVRPSATSAAPPARGSPAGTSAGRPGTVAARLLHHTTNNNSYSYSDSNSNSYSIGSQPDVINRVRVQQPQAPKDEVVGSPLYPHTPKSRGQARRYSESNPHAFSRISRPGNIEIQGGWRGERRTALRLRVPLVVPPPRHALCTWYDIFHMRNLLGWLETRLAQMTLITLT